MLQGERTVLDGQLRNSLAALGIHVVVAEHNAERGEQSVAEIRATGGKSDFVQTDLFDLSIARSLVKRAIELGGGNVDILFNKTGTG